VVASVEISVAGVAEAVGALLSEGVGLEPGLGLSAGDASGLGEVLSEGAGLVAGFGLVEAVGAGDWVLGRGPGCTGLLDGEQAKRIEILLETIKKEDMNLFLANIGFSWFLSSFFILLSVKSFSLILIDKTIT